MNAIEIILMRQLLLFQGLFVFELGMKTLELGLNRIFLGLNKIDF
jgi:hypothetical protein